MATTAHSQPASTGTTSNKDRLDRFYRYSQHEITGTLSFCSPSINQLKLTRPDLREQIVALEDRSTTNGEQANAIDHCTARIAGYADAVQDACSFLPPHDQRTYSEV